MTPGERVGGAGRRQRGGPGGFVGWGGRGAAAVARGRGLQSSGSRQGAPAASARSQSPQRDRSCSWGEIWRLKAGILGQQCRGAGCFARGEQSPLGGTSSVAPAAPQRSLGTALKVLSFKYLGYLSGGYGGERGRDRCVQLHWDRDGEQRAEGMPAGCAVSWSLPPRFQAGDIFTSLL